MILLSHSPQLLPSGKTVSVGPWSQGGQEMLAFGEMENVIATCPQAGFVGLA